MQSFCFVVRAPPRRLNFADANVVAFDSALQLVTEAIKYLTSAVQKEWNKKLFETPGALKAICEKVVIPQIKLRGESRVLLLC